MAELCYQERERVQFEGKRVLEIGCGPGLPGLLAAKLGARVHLTDYVDRVLELANLNVAGNGCTEAVSVHRLDWTKLEQSPQ